MDIKKVGIVVTILILSALSISFANQAKASWILDFVAPTCTMAFDPDIAAGIPEAGTTVDITVTTADNLSGVKFVQIKKSNPNNPSDVQNFYASTNSSFTYSWPTSSLSAGTYTFWVETYDNAGNKTTDCTVSGAIPSNTGTPPCTGAACYTLEANPGAWVQTINGDIHSN